MSEAERSLRAVYNLTNDLESWEHRNTIYSALAV